jgi:predicted acylesterase/phospholipase RssA
METAGNHSTAADGSNVNPAPRSAEAAQRNGLPFCNLVMKGGITSGIVYPPAVLKLKDRFRFSCVGGTSAGAIAAAVTAAAEYGRDTCGFHRLRELNDALSKPGFMKGLFQAQKPVQPLMRAAEDLYNRLIPASSKLTGGRLKRLIIRSLIAVTFRNATIPFLAASFPFFCIAVIVSFAVSTVVRHLIVRTTAQLDVFLAIFITSVILAGAVSLGVGVIVGAFRLANLLFHNVRINYFGLCNGSMPGKASDTAPLTDWLEAQINRIAGPEPDKWDRPLTFKDLNDKGVTLRMVTTNLSQNQPYAIPFRDNSFLFKIEDVKALFPKRVLDYMISAAHHSSKATPPPGYCFLPVGDALPVVVGMRLSLSFPLLISMVRLYTVNVHAFKRQDRDSVIQLTEQDLQPNWFSDGGISSNFPIHFFDSWLPTHPTFGINLTEMPSDAFVTVGTPSQTAVQPDQWTSRIADTYFSVSDSQQVTGDANHAEIPEQRQRPEEDQNLGQVVYLQPANRVPAPAWKPIDGLVDFFKSIWSTAQNYHDNSQSTLPSYRERIVQICFRADEGGLNLAMRTETIDAIKAKGEAAGALLCNFNFDQHRWVRLLVLLGQLETRLNEMRCAYPNLEAFTSMLKLQRESDPKFPYCRHDEAWSEAAIQRLQLLTQFLDDLKAVDAEWRKQHNDEPFFANRSPKPSPVLRMTPEF